MLLGNVTITDIGCSYSEDQNLAHEMHRSQFNWFAPIDIRALYSEVDLHLLAHCAMKFRKTVQFRFYQSNTRVLMYCDYAWMEVSTVPHLIHI